MSTKAWHTLGDFPPVYIILGLMCVPVVKPGFNSVLSYSIPSLIMLTFFTPLNSLLRENNVKFWLSPCIPSIVDIIEDKTFILQLFYHCPTSDLCTIMSGDL